MIRKLRKTDLDEVAYIWLHTNKKAHDFIAETDWDEHFDGRGNAWRCRDLCV